MRPQVRRALGVDSVDRTTHCAVSVSSGKRGSRASRRAARRRSTMPGRRRRRSRPARRARAGTRRPPGPGTAPVYTVPQRLIALAPARLGDRGRQRAVEVGLRARSAGVVARSWSSVGATNGRATRREHGARARPPPARPKRAPGGAHELDPARAGEHADERGGQRDVAQVAGEARLRHRRHDDHQHARGRRERSSRTPARRSRHARTSAISRAEQHRRREDRARAPEHLEEREVRRTPRESGFGWRARWPARSQSPEPQYSGTNHRKPQAAKARADRATRRRGSRPGQPEPVEAQERPHLRPQQRGGEAEQERVGRGGRRGGARPPTGTTATSRPSELPRAEVAHELVGEQQRERRDHARRRGRRAARRAGRPSRSRARRRRARSPATARARRRRRASANGVVKSTGSGFHDGPLTVLRSRCGDLAAPDDPRPRVVGRRRRAEQRQRGEPEAAEHEQPSTGARRPARVRARAATGAAGVRRVRRAATDTAGIMPMARGAHSVTIRIEPSTSCSATGRSRGARTARRAGALAAPVATIVQRSRRRCSASSASSSARRRSRAGSGRGATTSRWMSTSGPVRFHATAPTSRSPSKAPRNARRRVRSRRGVSRQRRQRARADQLGLDAVGRALERDDRRRALPASPRSSGRISSSRQPSAERDAARRPRRSARRPRPTRRARGRARRAARSQALRELARRGARAASCRPTPARAWRRAWSRRPRLPSCSVVGGERRSGPAAPSVDQQLEARARGRSRAARAARTRARSAARATSRARRGRPRPASRRAPPRRGRRATVRGSAPGMSGSLAARPARARGDDRARAARARRGRRARAGTRARSPPRGRAPSATAGYGPGRLEPRGGRARARRRGARRRRWRAGRGRAGCGSRRRPRARRAA